MSNDWCRRAISYFVGLLSEGLIVYPACEGLPYDVVLEGKNNLVTPTENGG
jgi:hypothetical protein